MTTLSLPDREIRQFIRTQRTDVRGDYTPLDVEIYLRAIVVTVSACRWPFSELDANTSLYRELGWTQETVESFHEVLEQVFGVALPMLECLCARTLGDLSGLVGRALLRADRMASGEPAPACA